MIQTEPRSNIAAQDEASERGKKREEKKKKKKERRKEGKVADLGVVWAGVMVLLKVPLPHDHRPEPPKRRHRAIYGGGSAGDGQE